NIAGLDRKLVTARVRIPGGSATTAIVDAQDTTRLYRIARDRLGKAVKIARIAAEAGETDDREEGAVPGMTRGVRILGCKNRRPVPDPDDMLDDSGVVPEPVQQPVLRPTTRSRASLLIAV